MAAPPDVIPCSPWTTPELVQACCSGLDPDYDLEGAIDFATAILFRLSGRQFPGECERTIWPCFPAGTLVTTLTGQVPIEKIRPGDVVMTHLGRWRSVTRSGQTGVEETFLLKGQGGEVSATADHKFLSREVRAFNWTERKVKVGEPEWTAASDMVGRAWTVPRPSEETAPIVPQGFDPHDESFWWMVGRWVGDGWTQADAVDSSPSTSSVFICCGKHEKEDLALALAESGTDWKASEQRTTFRFRSQNGPLRAWLNENFGRGADGKDLPGWLLTAPEAVRAAFLDGYVSADGSKRPTKSGRIETRVSTVSERLSRSLMVLCVGLGKSVSTYTSAGGTAVIEGREVSTKKAYHLSWIDGPTKYSWLSDTDFSARVKQITASGISVPVYDIEVEEDHSFLANGFAVHNCRGSNCGCCEAGWSGNWSFHAYPAYPLPNGHGDGFINVGRCNEACRLEKIKLPGTINSINEVWIDGELLDPSAYKINAYRWLARVDGGKWPCTNNLSGEIGDPDTWTISYNYGKPVPADGRYAASIFACEIAKEHCGGDSCLPQRLKSIEREGVSMVFPDPLEFLEHGEVGIYEVDLWLKSVNPSRLKRRARLHRPDRPRGNTSFT